jgi:hypothetical protein
MRILLALPLLATCAAGANATSVRDDEGPVVIELFTSQGCSSCPPADALVNELARAGRSGGRALAPLTFHVDYWNDLGWTDPYSSPAWTARQQAYARALNDRVYTPELVVAGAAGMVGSRGGEVERAIADAPRVGQLAATASWNAGHVKITATAPEGAEVWVAVWADRTQTKVLRGENQGEVLASERVVRELEKVGAPGQAGAIEVPIDGAWRAGGAVVFAQRGDRRIVAARLLPRLLAR